MLHVFSGDNPQYWERQLSTANTEVLCVDLQGGCHANLLDKHVYGFLLTIAASGKLRALLGGPPCRTVSALRSQGDGGPGELRTEEHPYGLPTLSMADMEKVQNDSILFFRFLSLYAVAKEVQLPSDPSPQLILEQPRDPKEYRPPEDLNRNNYMSMFRTAAWKRFAEVFELYKIDFDQGPMGHERRKPTTLFTTMEVLLQLDGIHGAPEHPPQDLRDQPLQKRMEASKRWAAWAPGLKQALVVAIRQHLQELEYERAAQDQGAERSDQRARHASVQPLQEGPGQSNNQISVQSLEPDSIQQQDETMEVNQRGYQAQRPEGSQRPPMAKALGPVALEQWKRHFLNDHLPARRDCSHCVRAQGRSKPHRRIQHPAAYTLSVDLSGRMTPGDDQQVKACKYLLVGCYTYPVTRDGRSLVQVPGKPDEDADVPLPGPDAEMSDAEEQQDPPEDVLLEEEDVETEAVESPATRRAKSMNETWKKLIEQAENVTVRQLTFVEPVKSRSVKHLLPALSKVHARIRAMGLPIYRIHSDRAREFSSAEMQSWALDRNILTTMTSGSSYKANGRVEAEMGMVKKSIRTLITAGVCTLSQWPLAARHIGERRLRSQLNLLGWPVGRLLRFGAKAYALRKSWQSRYAPWREVREPVIILGPDAHASLTNTGYFVKSVDTGRCFYTDDIVVPEVQQPAVEDQVLYLPERLDDAPQRRHRTKAPLPAISMLDIEGEEKIVNRFPEMFEPTTPSHHGGSSDSWSMCTVTSSHESSWTPKSIEVEEEGWWIGGGDEEGAPNSQDGGSRLTASNNASMTNPAALRALHVNLTHYVEDEMAVLDGTAAEQSLWLGNVTEAIKMKAMIEEQLTEAQAHDAGEIQKKLEQEFLVTKTIGNAEVWADLDAWSDSIRQEYDQLVNKKQAVRQITKAQLQQMASEMKLPIEILPGKMVHTRKSGSGAYRSRAVICGNYAGPDNNEHYAGGVDGQQVRAMVRLGALKQWQIGCTDIRTAFLNAPRRDTKRLIAMEIPSVFRKLQLAGHQDLWLVDKALYGLTTSPRDWGLHRDEVLPTVSWCRQREGRDVRGSFKKTPDENIWRIEEVDTISGEVHWTGLMSVYVDDLLFAAESGALDALTTAVEKVWAISDLEKTGEGKIVKYCGFEIEAAPNNDGYVISQKKYEQEMVKRFGITQATDFPHVNLSEDDEVPSGEIKESEVKLAQSMAGALLWLTTRTRPDIAMTVSSACRLATKNPCKSVEISKAVMQYVLKVQGGLHYPQGVPKETWGKRGQLHIERHDRLLEVFADIAYGTGSRHRSLQGLAVYFAGAPISWVSSQQPFVTYSTAEAELVSYCEALCAGRATEALICSMLKEPVGQNSLERVIYGDNMAAISMAHGTGNATWRTRHLRVRSSFLKEALDGVAPDGAWKLLHLRGTELVADGLTKPLAGQAFFKFVDDLGFAGARAENSNEEPMEHATGGGGNYAVIRAMALGSVLLSTAEGASEENDAGEDFSLIWTTGLLLVAMGAAYAGQLFHSATKCCLKRLRESKESGHRPSLRRLSAELSEEEDIMMVSEETKKKNRKNGGKAAGVMSRSRDQTQEAAGSSSRPMTSSTPEQGPPTSRPCSMSMTLRQRSGTAERAASAAASSAAGAAASPAACAAASLAAASSALSDAAVVMEASAAAAERRGADGVSKDIVNPWNRFQHENRRKGWSPSVMAEMYRISHKTGNTKP